MEIEYAKQLATRYHKGQVDKAGDPYIQHCLRVGNGAATYGRTEKEVIALAQIGFLHDIIEDTEMSSSRLRSLRIDSQVIKTVLVLTKSETDTYREYIERVCEDSYARIVKLVDLEDHLVPNKTFTLPDSMKKRYEQAKARILQEMEKAGQSYSNHINQ